MMEISTLTPNMEILHDGRLDHRNPTMRRHSAFASSDRRLWRWRHICRFVTDCGDKLAKVPGHKNREIVADKLVKIGHGHYQ